jgi:hypothetical protein
MIDFMYTFRYRDFDKGDQGALLFHIKLFALADKYDICRLRNMTVSRFKEIAGCRLYSELIVAIEAVYTTTPSSVRGLREAAIETADYHLKSLLENQSFQDFMDKNGEFGKDLTKKIHSETYARPESLGLIHFQCSDCELSFLMNVYDVEQYDLDNAKSPLVHKNGWLKCVCPRCGCHARSDSYFCGMAESGFHFLKYSCKGTSDNCGKVIFCSHEDEKLDEKRGLHINCPICPWWMTLEGKA